MPVGNPRYSLQTARWATLANQSYLHLKTIGNDGWSGAEIGTGEQELSVCQQYLKNGSLGPPQGSDIDRRRFVTLHYAESTRMVRGSGLGNLWPDQKEGKSLCSTSHKCSCSASVCIILLGSGSNRHLLFRTLIHRFDIPSHLWFTTSTENARGVFKKAECCKGIPLTTISVRYIYIYIYVDV